MSNESGGSAFSVDQLTKELRREKHKRRYGVVLRSTVYALITVAAVAVLVATLWLPILQIYGTSMTPTLTDGDIVVSFKGSKFSQGDLIAFYSGNKLLVKRVIAGPSDWVNIDEDGNVYVNGLQLDEPYLTEKALGDCNIDLPYQVPESSYFVMGDHRNNSADSRNTAVGPVNEDLIVGRIVFRVWPFDKFGKITAAAVGDQSDMQPQTTSDAQPQTQSELPPEVSDASSDDEPASRSDDLSDESSFVSSGDPEEEQNT